jgi:hypothetical protein
MNITWAKFVTAVTVACSFVVAMSLNITANNLSEINCTINGGEFDRSVFAGFSQCFIDATTEE